AAKVRGSRLCSRELRPIWGELSSVPLPLRFTKAAGCPKERPTALLFQATSAILPAVVVRSRRSKDAHSSENHAGYGCCLPGLLHAAPRDPGVQQRRKYATQ